MIVPGVLAFLPMLVGLTASGGVQAQPGARALNGGQELILRVPVRPLPPPRIVWQPARPLRCVPIRAIRGAMLSSPAHIDILLPQQQRVRAKLDEDCPGLDFYGGFYLKPKDARLCAGRDIIYSRMGGSCRIEGITQLLPRLRRQIP